MLCPNKAINLSVNVIDEIRYIIELAYSRPDENVKKINLNK